LVIHHLWPVTTAESVPAALPHEAFLRIATSTCFRILCQISSFNGFEQIITGHSKDVLAAFGKSNDVQNLMPAC